MLERETHDQLNYISRRMGVSRSELVRDVLAEPVAMMAKWVRSVPDEPTPEDADKSAGLLQLDMLEFLTANVSEIGLRVVKP